MLKRARLELAPPFGDQEMLLRTTLTYVLLVEIQTRGGCRTWRHNLLNLLAKFKLGFFRTYQLGHLSFGYFAIRLSSMIYVLLKSRVAKNKIQP